MRLVDGKQRDLHAPHHLGKAGRGGAFRGHIEKIEFAAGKRAPHG